EWWTGSDGGGAGYRIGGEGCFRGAVPLPDGVDPREVSAVRVPAFERPPRNGSPAPAATAVELTRINRVFYLGPQYVPMRTLVEWRGLETIRPGSPFGLPVVKPQPVG